MPETYPWAWYSAPRGVGGRARADLRGAWHYVGDVGRLPEPGSYFACTSGGLPVVVMRDGDGELRAFLNVCRHRGSEIVSGAGRRATLQCPYHAWTYGLDGGLRAAPRSDREAGFDSTGLGLVPLRLEVWGPFLLANADLDAVSPADTLAAVRLPFDPASLVFRERVHYAVDANWKIAVENYLECYHCPVAHPGFSALVDVDPDAYALDGEGPVLPESPRRTVGFLDYFFAPDVDEAWARELIAFDDRVGEEDRALVESVQRGVGSGFLEGAGCCPKANV